MNRHDTRQHRQFSSTGALVDTVTRIEKWTALDAAGDWLKLHQFALEWTQDQPDNPLAWQSLGGALRKLRRPSEAITALRRGIALAPPATVEIFGRRPAGPLWFNLAHAYVEAGDNDRAKAAFKEAARIDPAVAEIWNDLGVVCLNTNDAPGAIDAFRQAVKLDPKSVTGLKNLGLVYAMCGDEEGVRAVHQQLLALDARAAKEFVAMARQLMSN